jgi:hypothetical protein
MRFSYAGQSDARASRSGQPVEEIARILYEPRRMERRFFLFENLCLPSIAWQKNQDFRLVILASKIMPDVYKERLAELTAPIPQIEILYGDGQHVTISQNMTARLQAATALAPLVRIVTYPSGLYLSHQQGESHLLREYFPNIGIGMAFLNMPGQIQNPYQCQHVAVSRSTPTFSDPVPLAYIHTAHASSDTLGRQGTKFRKMLAAAKDRDAPGTLKRIRLGLRREFPGVTIEALKALIAQASAI